jgi:hypothetical protein
MQADNNVARESTTTRCVHDVARDQAIESPLRVLLLAFQRSAAKVLTVDARPAVHKARSDEIADESRCNQRLELLPSESGVRRPCGMFRTHHGRSLLVECTQDGGACRKSGLIGTP